MDLNLTGMIATNVNLHEPWYSGSASLIFAALLGAAATGIFTLLKDYFNNKQLKKDKQIQAISRLYGRKHTMLQSQASYFSAFIQSESHSCFAKMQAIQQIDYDQVQFLAREGKQDEAQQYVNQEINSYLEKSQSLKESLREKRRSEELQKLNAKNDERLWETIGKIIALFPDKNVKDLVSSIKKYDEDFGNFEKDIVNSISPIIKKIEDDPGKIKDIMKSNVDRNAWTYNIQIELKNWTNTQSDTLRCWIEGYDTKIEILLNYLESKI